MNTARALFALGILLTSAPGSSNDESPSDEKQTEKSGNGQIEVILHKKDGQSVVGDENTGQTDAKGGGPQPSKFWLGVNACEVGDALRSHLKLTKRVGLLVLDVSPDSPASAAGLKQHDVLIQFGDHELVSNADLSAAVQKYAGKEAVLQIYRAGKKLTVKVTTAKRPEKLANAVFSRLQPANFKIAPDAPGKSARGNPRFRFVGPGIVVNSQHEPNAGKNYTIRIFTDKDGVKNAVVKSEGGTYEATAATVHKLPYEYRSLIAPALNSAYRIDCDFTVNGRSLTQQSGGVWVQRWLGGAWGGWGPAGIQLVPTGFWVRGNDAGQNVNTIAGNNVSVEKKLELMNRKLDGLQKAIERLQSGGK